jgi:hypothetical protein
MVAVRHTEGPSPGGEIMPVCAHLDQVTVDLPRDVEGCEECLRIGGRWLHLRACRSCGKVGCCDSSPNRHATAHNHETGHPVVTSAQPDEDWSYCYADDVVFLISDRA